MTATSTSDSKDCVAYIFGEQANIVLNVHINHKAY